MQWLSCHTQEEIAAAEDVDQSIISDKIKNFMVFANFSKNHKTAAEYSDDKRHTNPRDYWIYMLYAFHL